MRVWFVFVCVTQVIEICIGKSWIIRGGLLKQGNGLEAVAQSQIKAAQIVFSFGIGRVDFQSSLEFLFGPREVPTCFLDDSTLIMRLGKIGIQRYRLCQLALLFPGISKLVKRHRQVIVHGGIVRCHFQSFAKSRGSPLRVALGQQTPPLNSQNVNTLTSFGPVLCLCIGLHLFRGLGRFVFPAKRSLVGREPQAH